MHEWAHIRNGDLWLLALGRCLLVLLFPHPLFWWLRRAIRGDQELLADAAAAGDNRPAYCEELLRLVRKTAYPSPIAASVAVGIWESPSQLSRRIAMLLDENFHVAPTAPRRWRYRALGLLLLLGAACSLLTLQPARSDSPLPLGEGRGVRASDSAPGARAPRPPPQAARPRLRRPRWNFGFDLFGYSTPLLGMQLSIDPRTPGRDDLVVDLSRIDWRIVDAEGRAVEPQSTSKPKSPDWFNPSADGSRGRVIALEHSWKGGKIEVGGKSWQLKPGKYALEAILDTSADQPGRMGGDHRPLGEIWIGSLKLPRMPFEVIGEVSDEALDAAVKKVRAAHPAGGAAMWRGWPNWSALA